MVMRVRGLSRLGGVAGIAAGLSWLYLALREVRGAGVGDAIPWPSNTQYLFWVPALLVAATLLSMSPSLGTIQRLALRVAAIGALLQAAGLVTMGCAPTIRDALGRVALDCGPVGAVVSTLGVSVLHGALLVAGLSSDHGAWSLSRARVVLLGLAVVGIATLPAGYLGSYLGLAVAHGIGFGCQLLRGAGWLLLGVMLVRRSALSKAPGWVRP